MSAEHRRRGLRSSYIGSEVFLSLVDAAQAPFSGDLRQLSIHTLCTNRDLVLHMPVGISQERFHARCRGAGGADSRGGGPEPAVRAAWPMATSSWRAISHLSLNYLSLVNSTEQEGAAALRDLLELYAASSDSSARKQIESIRSVRVSPVVRRLPSTRREVSVRARGNAVEARLRSWSRDHRGGRRVGVRRWKLVLDRVCARPVLQALRVDQLVH